MKKKKVALWLWGFLTVGLLTGVAGCQKGNACVSIVNGSRVQIVKGQVNVGNESRQFQRLDPGAQIELHFNVLKDSHYEVFADLGTRQLEEKNLGYLTRGMSINDTIIVTDQSILLNPDKQ